MMREFTGKHMAGVLVAGFGIVVAVNFYMASLATNGFGGVVVENSYVASQKYNGWLAEAARQEATGWQLDASRTEDGLVVVETQNAPETAMLTAVARHPLGKKTTRTLAFTRQDDGRFIANQPLDAGRWTLRMTLSDGDRKRVIEAPLS
ncbi:FixH family protein [Citromicrobium bathyomarinum]